jgi:hypothetical protein
LTFYTSFITLSYLKPYLPEIMNLKLVVSFFVLGILFNLANVQCNPPESCLLFSITSQSKVRLGVINTSNKSLNLEITNKNGNIFLKETTKRGANYFQLLDLSKMPDGEYTVKLSGLDKDIKKRFLISNNKIKMETIIEPIFRVLDNNMLMVFYKNTQGKPVNIAFEQSNQVVFEEKNITEPILNKRYSLKQLPRGQFTVKLYSDDDVFNYSLEIK